VKEFINDARVQQKHFFVWCSYHQQNKPLANCPSCHKFPCSELRPSDIEKLKNEVDIIIGVEKLLKRKVGKMFFLIDKEGVIHEHKKDLENLPSELESAIVEAVEVAPHFFEQKLTWIAKDKIKEVDSETDDPDNEIFAVVSYKDSSLKLENINPNQPNPEVVRIYPVKKHWVRQYVLVKVPLEAKKAKKTAASSK